MIFLIIQFYFRDNVVSVFQAQDDFFIKVKKKKKKKKKKKEGD